MPYWPGVTDSPRTEQLRDVMRNDLRNARRMMLEIGKGPYWQGKGLMRITKMADVAEQQGDLEARDRLLGLAKKRIEEWYSGQSNRTYFHYDKAMGTVVAYPEEFFFVEQLNDHHFTWGYWIRAMADIALRDPAWASQQQWGAMTDLLIADIATAERGRADFPFLRNFDPYEGHSWASGIGLGEHGNNQESSSEAISAWAGLILWGEITGNRALRDLGVFLYTTEVEAINHYWFDIHGLVLAPEYKNVEVSMLFGAKYAHNTWWTDEPRQIKGINMLPITTASTYLGRDPKYVKKNMDALKVETEIYESRFKKAKPPDIWQDIFAKYLALADPAAGLASWDRWGAFEFGDTRTHTLHWLLSLEKMGPPDFSVTADTPLYSVFRRADGKRTYLAFNATKAPIQVRFSDGKMLDVAPGTLGQATASPGGRRQGKPQSQPCRAYHRLKALSLYHGLSLSTKALADGWNFGRSARSRQGRGPGGAARSTRPPAPSMAAQRGQDPSRKTSMRHLVPCVRAPLAALAAALLLNACGGGDASPPPTPLDTSGYAVDGYLSGAAVLCDADRDGLVTAGETSVSTTSAGLFVFPGGCVTRWW